MKRLLQENRAVVQLAPPHIHRRNSVECAIRNFKNNFVSGLESVDNNFPIYLWCRMVKQLEITINLLRTLITNPRLSAYLQIFRQFDFNATPMAPPGTKKLHMKNKRNVQHG